MNFLCQLSNTLINCCSQLSAIVQMSLITNAPIGPTPPFSLPLTVSWSPLPLPPFQLVFPAALALQGTQRQRSRNCVLLMLHCFLDRFQPSGSLISNLYDRWNKKAQSIPFVCQFYTRQICNTAKKKKKAYSNCITSIVWLICPVGINCPTSLCASNKISYLYSWQVKCEITKRDGGKQG